MHHDPAYPWVFHRDEVDLLEDEIEDLYQKYNPKKDSESTLEVDILREQIETEERSDAELTFRLSVDDFNSSDSRPKIDSYPDIIPLSQTLHHVIRRGPLYVHARRWAHEVFAFAKQRYAIGDHSREMFRVYANTNLVPIKISVAMAEEANGDRFGLEIALEEYGLALTYLKRTTESLQGIEQRSLLEEPFKRMYARSARIRRMLEERINGIKHRKG